MKFSRPIIGLLAIILALWVIVGEQMSGASSGAVVNARVVTLRAPVSGEVTMAKRALGAKVAEGDIVASISDPLVDSLRLDDLHLEVNLAKAGLARLTSEQEAVSLRQEVLEQRSATYHGERLEELRLRLGHARSQLELAGKGGAPAGTAAWAADAAAERVAVLETELRAAEAGVYLGDGYNDAPFSQQRALDLAQQSADLAIRRDEAEMRLVALNERLARERVRVGAQGGGEMAAPVSGLFWEVLEADRVTVQRGDPLLRLVDCNSVMVTVSVSERVYNSLKAGGAAQFRLDGQSRIYDATILRLAGSGAETIYRNLAIAPGRQHLEGYDVTLLVPGLNGLEAGCLIGQTGRAFFERRPLDWLRGGLF